MVVKSDEVGRKHQHFCCEAPNTLGGPGFPSVYGDVDTDWLHFGVNNSFQGFLLKNEPAGFRECIVTFTRVQRPCHSKESIFFFLYHLNGYAFYL